MTLATELVLVSENASLAEAEEIALTHNVRHLLIVNDDVLVGVVCRCDLLGPSDEREIIADRMAYSPLVIECSATIAQAAEAMTMEQVGCLPVVVHGLVCGVITRGDLRRLGVHEKYLGAGSCVACGNVHGVAQHPKLPDTKFCLDCIEASYAPIEYDELGVGD